jgi:tetratricopeptide (TPR) repeat protein
MLARVIKNNLRFKLREKMKQLKLPLEEPYRRLVIDYLNLVFGNHNLSDKYWNGWLKKDLIVNFTDALTPEEEAEEFDLKPRKRFVNTLIVDQDFMAFLFDRVRKMMNMRFSSRLFNFNLQQPFDDTDLESIGERVKHMNIVAHAEGFFYHMKGLTNRVEDPLNAQRFYEIAIEKFEEALDSNPNNKEILLSIALTYILMIEEENKAKAKPSAYLDPNDPRVKKAEEYSLRAIAAEPKYDSFSLFRYAQFLERCGNLETAEDYYLQALEADPNNAGCLHCYGNFLSDRGQHEEAEKFYLRSSQTTIGKHMPEYYY